MASTFAGVDFYDVDSLLSEEERAVRDTVRAWVDEHLMPVIGDAYIEGKFPEAADSRDGGAGPPRRQPARGVRLRRAQQRGVRPHHAGARAGRQRHPLVRLGAGRAGDVPDLRLRLRGAEEALAAAAGRGRGHRLLRPDRARLRLQPRRHDHHGAGRRRTAGSSTAPRCGSPTARRPPSSIIWAKTGAIDDAKSIRGFIVPTRHEGLHREGPEGQALAPRLATPASSSCRTVLLPEGRDPAEVGRDQEPAHVPDAGALRHRLGRHRRRDGLLRRGAAATRRTAIMFGKPIGQTQLQQVAPGRDADRDHQGAAARPPARAPQGHRAR